jgi:CDP-diacylglycerol--glycerol-3-phosphate 3-phosphatidyltransferase
VTDLLTSSPRANGFYKGGIVKKYIPAFYRINELNTLKMNQSKGNSNVSIYEYEKGEWTFHAKGAWIYEKG